MTKQKPSEDVGLKGKQFAAKVRAAGDALQAKHRRPSKEFPGGYEVLPNEKLYAILGKQFGLPAHQIGRYFTYSRNGICTHPWSAGACKDCPRVDHLLMPKDI